MSFRDKYNTLLELENYTEGIQEHSSIKIIITVIALTITVNLHLNKVSSILIGLTFLFNLIVFSKPKTKFWIKRLFTILPIITLFSIGFLFSKQYMEFFAILTKGLLCISYLSLLIVSTGFDEICNTLIKFKIPKLFVLQLSLIYRYLFLFSQELLTMQEAYMLRSKLKKGVAISDVGPFLGSLLLRNIEYGEKVYYAMSCRGAFMNKESHKISKDIDDNLIKIENLETQYSENKKVLNGINLEIKKGDKIAIIGKNGAGKTTLLSSFVGLIDIKDGQIKVDNINVEKRNYTKIRKIVGYVFQNPDQQLFKSKVYDDIIFGPKNYDMNEKEISEKLEQLLDEFDAKTLLNRFIHTLSGGEKRLIALIGILILSPKIILLDEPTIYLDNKTRKVLIKYLKESPLTQLIATHDLDFALDICNKTLILDNGKIAKYGNTKDILADEKLLNKYELDLPLKLQGGVKYEQQV